MMNSHIAIFFAGTENVGSAISCAECPGMVSSAWLTSPPAFERPFQSVRSELHPKQQKQIQPQCTHEMPIPRGRVQRAFSQDGSARKMSVQFPNHADHTAQPAEQMHGMRHGQHIKERVAYVRGHSESLGSQSHPREGLPRNK